jgi:hypothetical protein
VLQIPTAITLVGSRSSCALRVDAIADSWQRYGGRAFNYGMREAALHHVPVDVARCGDGWETGDGVTLSVLSPCGTLFVDGKNDVNENSVVAMLDYGDFRMLSWTRVVRPRSVCSKAASICTPTF